jgi:hypothetical protein
MVGEYINEAEREDNQRDNLTARADDPLSQRNAVNPSLQNQKGMFSPS